MPKTAALCADRRPRDRFGPVGARQNLALYYNGYCYILKLAY